LREFDLRALLEALNEQEVRFVVIGGVAVGAHGYVRGTEGLGLVPDPDPQNLERLTQALGELESTLPTVRERAFDPATDAGVIRRGGNVTVMTRFGASTWCNEHAECPAIPSLRKTP
jgi:hypothetical protein